MFTVERLKEIQYSLLDDKWESLVINRRKSHTIRLWRMFGDERVCCHIFEPCLEEETFAHPHPWPGEFFILKGKYKQEIGLSTSINSPPTWHFSSIYEKGSSYVIDNKFTWHKVTPLETTYTIMKNGKPFENPHSEVRTTKGKDLESLNDISREIQQIKFANLIYQYLDE